MISVHDVIYIVVGVLILASLLMGLGYLTYKAVMYNYNRQVKKQDNYIKKLYER